MSRCQTGQASLELIALLGLVAAAAAATLSLFAAGSAAEAARAAAHSGAVALAQKRDVRRASRAALPAWARPRARVTIAGSRVSVTVEPRAPLRSLRRLLRGRAEVDAGEPAR